MCKVNRRYMFMKKNLILLFAIVFSFFIHKIAYSQLVIWRSDHKSNSGVHLTDEKGSYLALKGFIQPGFVVPFQDEEAGFFHQELGESRFVLQRARIGMKARLYASMTFNLSFEASDGNLQDVYIDYAFFPWLKLRAGQLRVPFLNNFRYNELHLSFIDRYLYEPNLISPVMRHLDPRDIGGYVWGRVDFTSDPTKWPVLEYWAGMFLGGGLNVQNKDKAFMYVLRLQLHTLGYPDGVDREGDLAYNFMPKFLVAASLYSNCRSNDNREWVRGFNLDTEFRWRGLYASAAFLWFRAGPVSGNQFGYKHGCGLKESDLDVDNYIAFGASVQLQYLLPTMLFFDDQGLELLFRFDWSSPNNPSTGSFLGGDENSPGYMIPTGFDSGNYPTHYRVTLGFNWFPTREQKFRLQFNYQINREKEDISSGGELVGETANDVIWVQVTVGL